MPTTFNVIDAGVITALLNNTVLQIFGGGSLTNEQISDAFLAALSQTSSLQYLDLSSSPVGDAGVERIMGALKNNTRLSNLVLFLNGIGGSTPTARITDNGGLAVASLVSQRPNLLSVLSINANPGLTDVTGTAIAVALLSQPNIDQIDMGGCNFGASTGSACADFLGLGANKLSLLLLNDNNITNAVAESIVAVLPENPSMQYISLDGNPQVLQQTLNDLNAALNAHAICVDPSKCPKLVKRSISISSVPNTRTPITINDLFMVDANNNAFPLAEEGNLFFNVSISGGGRVYLNDTPVVRVTQAQIRAGWVSFNNSGVAVGGRPNITIRGYRGNFSTLAAFQMNVSLLAAPATTPVPTTSTTTTSQPTTTITTTITQAVTTATTTITDAATTATTTITQALTNATTAATTATTQVITQAVTNATQAITNATTAATTALTELLTTAAATTTTEATMAAITNATTAATEAITTATTTATQAITAALTSTTTTTEAITAAITNATTALTAAITSATTAATDVITTATTTATQAATIAANTTQAATQAVSATQAATNATQAATQAANATQAATQAANATQAATNATQATTRAVTTSTTTTLATTTTKTGSAIAPVVTPAPAASSSGGVDLGLIVGAAVGGGLGLLIIALCIFYWCYYRPKRKVEDNNKDSESAKASQSALLPATKEQADFTALTERSRRWHTGAGVAVRSSADTDRTYAPPYAYVAGGEGTGYGDVSAVGNGDEVEYAQPEDFKRPAKPASEDNDVSYDNPVFQGQGNAGSHAAEDMYALGNNNDTYGEAGKPQQKAVKAEDMYALGNNNETYGEAGKPQQKGVKAEDMYALGNNNETYGEVGRPQQKGVKAEDMYALGNNNETYGEVGRPQQKGVKAEDMYALGNNNETYGEVGRPQQKAVVAEDMYALGNNNETYGEAGKPQQKAVAAEGDYDLAADDTPKQPAHVTRQATRREPPQAASAPAAAAAPTDKLIDLVATDRLMAEVLAQSEKHAAMTLGGQPSLKALAEEETAHLDNLSQIGVLISKPSSKPKKIRQAAQTFLDALPEIMPEDSTAPLKTIRSFLTIKNAELANKANTEAVNAMTASLKSYYAATKKAITEHTKQHKEKFLQARNANPRALFLWLLHESAELTLELTEELTNSKNQKIKRVLLTYCSALKKTKQISADWRNDAAFIQQRTVLNSLSEVATSLAANVSHEKICDGVVSLLKTFAAMNPLPAEAIACQRSLNEQLIKAGINLPVAETRFAAVKGVPDSHNSHTDADGEEEGDYANFVPGAGILVSPDGDDIYGTHPVSGGYLMTQVDAENEAADSGVPDDYLETGPSDDTNSSSSDDTHHKSVGNNNPIGWPKDPRRTFTFADHTKTQRRPGPKDSVHTAIRAIPQLLS